jgi:hypothetical protein
MNEANFTVPFTDLEPDIGDAPLSEKINAGSDSPVRVHFHSLRHRLADSDGISGKAAIDGMVKANLLKDDSAKYVKSVTHSQEKTKGPEITEITITGWTGFIGE